MPFIPRKEIGRRLRAQIDAGTPIVGCGADLMIIYNSGRYRMAGRGSLAGLMPYGDANGIVVEMAAEVLPVVKDTPVLAGVGGTDPFRLMPVFLKQLKEMGFDGVQNFPTVGLIDGDFRKNIEATGMGYDKEIEAIRLASQIDLFCSPYVFNPDDARAMAKAGADQLVAHVGLTTARSTGAPMPTRDPILSGRSPSEGPGIAASSPPRRCPCLGKKLSGVLDRHLRVLHTGHHPGKLTQSFLPAHRDDPTGGDVPVIGPTHDKMSVRVGRDLGKVSHHDDLSRCRQRRETSTHM